MKKIIVTIALLIAMTLAATKPTFAFDKRVTASGTKVYYDKKNNRDRAEGYVTSKSNHYCSVILFYFTNEQLAKSKRKWGKGKVSNKTKYVKCNMLGAQYDYARVYYGF